MAAEGLRTSGDLLHSQPDVPTSLSDIYSIFYLLDREGMSGRVTVESMRAMLDEMEIDDRYERMQLIRIWRGMDTAQQAIYRSRSESKRRRH
jgi:hypothetical protein